MESGNPRSCSNPTHPSAVPELVSDLAVDPRMAPVIETFVTEFPSLLAELAAAAARKDLSSIQTSAHKLKGAAGSAGFMRLLDLVSQVENHAEHGRPDAIRPLMDHLSRICQSAPSLAALSARS